MRVGNAFVFDARLNGVMTIGAIYSAQRIMKRITVQPRICWSALKWWPVRWWYLGGCARQYAGEKCGGRAERLRGGGGIPVLAPS